MKVVTNTQRKCGNEGHKKTNRQKKMQKMKVTNRQKNVENEGHKYANRQRKCGKWRYK